MKKESIALFLSALVGFANELLAEHAGTPASSAPTNGDTPTGDVPKRGPGRPKKEEAAPTGDTKSSGDTSDADRFKANLALIEPVVKDGKGAEVKTMIKKHSPTGLKDLPADKQAQFEADLDALTY